MRVLKHPWMAAAALLALASPVLSQVKTYKDIKTPALRTFTVPQPRRVELSNGMVILLQEDHELPLIRGSALIHGGSRDVPADKAGLMGVLAGSWRTGGTETRTGDQLDDILESKAARVETSGSEDSTRVSLDVLKGDFDFVFPIFVEILQKPAFRQEKIDLAKTQSRTGISRRNDEPQSILFREANKLGYGADSPYARQTEYATLNNITREDLLAFHKRFVAPNNIVLGLVGDFDSATMEKKLRDAFSNWPRGEKAPPPPAVGASAKPGVYYVPKEDVTQGYIAAVHSANVLRSNPDYYAVTIMNDILSNGFSGRLMNDIRSREGLAYGVGGGLNPGWDRPAIFNAVVFGTKSPTTIQSIDLLKKEINDLQTKPFTAEELKAAKDADLNAYVFTVDSKAKVLNQRQQLEFYGYPADFYEKYQKAIEGVTIADVERVAKKYVHPDQLAILVVGNQKDFEKPLATAYGSATPIDITIPEPGSPASPAATTAKPAGTSNEGRTLINKVRDFVGGKNAIANVQTVREVGTMSVRTPQGPMEMEMESVTRFPESHRVVMKTPMGEMTMVSTADAAFMAGPMGQQDMPASQRQSMRSESKQDLLNVLKNADNPAYTFNIAGTEGTAQILDVNADGSTFKWYVDPTTGRVLKKVSQGRMGEQITEYTEWKNFGGVNLPVAFTVTAGGQPGGGGKLTTIEINPTVDPKAFDKPAAK
ncbi:MAG: insulinase family protein [Acidobacteriota bacterium]|nr:insulinase family protein [Acidobacteriota bacterium]